MKFLICNICNIWPSACEFRRVSVNSAKCHQVNASFNFRIGVCNNWLSDWNNCLSQCGPLVHSIILDDMMLTVTAQITLAAIKWWLRPNAKAPFTSATIFVLLAHSNTISCDSVKLRLGFFPLAPWPLPIRKCSKNPLQMRVKSGSWSEIISFLAGKCFDGDRLLGKISLHRIPTRLWCYLPFFNADSAYPLANSSAASFITTRSS
jgi:hypothetical protein